MTKHDFMAPPVPTIGVGGIVFNKHDEVLLIKRNQAPASGFWSIPGGKLEPDEFLAEACQREILEETGVTVAVVNVVAVVERKLEGFHYVIIDFFVKLVEGENSIPTAQSDVAEAKWVSLSELDSYALVDGLRDIIIRAYASQAANHQILGLHSSEKLPTDFILPRSRID